MAMSKRTCSIEGCERGGRIIRGWCYTHWQRWYRHGDPLGGGPIPYSTPEKAFAARTEWRGDCLIWTGARSDNGYGVLRVEGKKVYAHRYSWERAHGDIPEGMNIDHRKHCSPACVNPNHLRPATQSQNGQNRSGANTNNKITGLRNVVRRANGTYTVRIQKDGEYQHFGTYADLDQAAAAAKAARQEAFGTFAGKG